MTFTADRDTRAQRAAGTASAQGAVRPSAHALDIVFPAHDEERRIGPTLREYRQGIPDPDVRFILALDACTDGTLDIVRAHQAEDPRIEVLEFDKLGKGGVILEAFRRSGAEYVAFVDADCATPPRELLRLLDAARRNDGAIASRRHPSALLPRRRTRERRITSTVFALAVRLLFGLPYNDTQCGAKVLRGDAARELLRMVSTTDLLFDVDLLWSARRMGLRVVEVPTIWIERDGSKVDLGADIRRTGRSVARLLLRRRVLDPLRERRRHGTT